MIQHAVTIDQDENPICLREAAIILGSHPQHVRTLAKQGKVPSMQIDGRGRWFFYASELRMWMREAMRARLTGGESCQSDGRSTKMVKPKRLLSTSPSQVASDYEKALGLNLIKKTPNNAPANIMTNVSTISGDRRG